jgi:hypothetical protein
MLPGVKPDAQHQRVSATMHTVKKYNDDYVYNACAVM